MSAPLPLHTVFLLIRQDPNLEPGDVVGDRIPWVRYSDPAVKNFKLNAERNNGRAAMMGIAGMTIHEALTGNPVWPIPVPPQPVLEVIGDDIEKGPARVGSFVLASLGMVRRRQSSVDLSGCSPPLVHSQRI